MIDRSDLADIIDSLRRDHQQAEHLLDVFDESGGRADWFCNLRETLVRHETAEEIAVYPAIRHLGNPTKETVDQRISEQAESEKLLASMEKMELSSDEFIDAFAVLKRSVLDHAAMEEATIFPAIESDKSFEQRRMMGERYEKAKSAAPTHPHPHAPDTPPGNLILGPVAALADKIRDEMRNDDDQSHMSDASRNAE